MHDFSKQSLIEFIDTSIEKGRINVNTGAGIRAACNKILEQVDARDDARTVDVKQAVVQYANRHPGELSSDSLRVYESRVKNTIDNFVKSLTDPTGFKMPSKQNGSATRKVIRRTRPGVSTAGSIVPARPEADDAAAATRAAITETSLTIPFPLRPTFLAHVLIPRDLTKEEAKRLALFIDALAHDPQST